MPIAVVTCQIHQGVVLKKGGSVEAVALLPPVSRCCA